MIPLALIGVGKIARDQHLPAIAHSPDFALVGAVSLDPVDIGVPYAPTLRALKDAVPMLTAVSICTPPLGRVPLVREAFELGLDVMIEKPPAGTIGDAEHMRALARASGRTLFAAWHSREAAGVEPARRWLAERTVQSVRVRWLEDVRVWHPGQEWIWEPGIGVFDPGINALSILTEILGRLRLEAAELRFPANRAAPIAATLTLSNGNSAMVDCHFAFDFDGSPCWTIAISTDDGDLTLDHGGGALSINGVGDVSRGNDEYARLYARFARNIRGQVIDFDIAPLCLVADSYMRATRVIGAPFEW